MLWLGSHKRHEQLSMTNKRDSNLKTNDMSNIHPARWRRENGPMVDNMYNESGAFIVSILGTMAFMWMLFDTLNVDDEAMLNFHLVTI